MAGRFTVFSHLNAEKAGTYRRVLEVFSVARAEFVIHLRPAEVARGARLSEAEVEPVLDQLHEWGNLERSRDFVDASSIEEFYRVKWLYQLSARGEAAERALEVFDEAVDQPGELQDGALREIGEYLEAIRRLLPGPGVPPESAGIDIGKLHQQFNHLDARLEEFTLRAQRFMQFLQSTIELHGLTLEDFIDYKDRLIDYLQRFVNDLVTSAGEIEGMITALEAGGIRACFPAIARQARADALDPDDPGPLEIERHRREARWDGLRRWWPLEGTPFSPPWVGELAAAMAAAGGAVHEEELIDRLVADLDPAPHPHGAAAT